MRWFQKQLEQRRLSDEELFKKAFEDISESINGKSGFLEIENNENNNNAIAEMLKELGFKYTGDGDIGDLNEAIDRECRKNGIMNRSVSLTKNWYKNAIGVYICRRKDSSDIVTLVPTLGGYKYKDHISGKTKRVNKNFQKEFESEAIVFYRPLPLIRLKPWHLVKYSLTSKSVYDFAITFIFLGISTLFGLLTPMVTNFLYSEVLTAETNTAVVLLISTLIFGICVKISQLFFEQFRGTVEGKITDKVNTSMEAAVMMRLLYLPVNFFRKYSSGDLQKRVQYVSTLTAQIINVIMGTSFTVLFSLAYLGPMLSYAPTLVVPAVIITVVTILLSVVTSFISIKMSKNQMEISGKQNALEYDILSGIQKIKLAGAEKRVFAKWSKGFSKKLKYSYNPPAIILLNSTLSIAISYIGTIALYFFTIKSNISVADYAAFNVAYGMVSGAFSSLASIAVTIAQLKPIFDMARPILDEKPEMDSDREIISKVNGRIELSHVSFKYDEKSPNIIDDLSLTIKSGEYVAIVGRTGCGKSTLVRLLLGFEKPQKGLIMYDSKNIDSIDLKSLRRNIGTVMQDGKLFQGDIYSNIVISAPWLSKDEAWEAAEIAGIADDIREMPMQMNTIISEGSGGISGGQKQRLMIARAIASKPKILIFDEATSALDNIVQKHVSDALDKVKATRIVIAHRLSTIKNCDRIIYLENGKVLEEGGYDDLIAKNGKFAELVERQRIN